MEFNSMVPFVKMDQLEEMILKLTITDPEMIRILKV